jgi:putative transposase
MPGIKRIVAPGYPYHVTQRGNYQQPVFDEELVEIFTKK